MPTNTSSTHWPEGFGLVIQQVIQPSQSIIHPCSRLSTHLAGHPVISKYHPSIQRVIHPSQSIIHPCWRSSTHAEGHPAIPKYHPSIQRSSNHPKVSSTHAEGHPATSKYHPPIQQVIHTCSRSSSDPKVSSTHSAFHSGIPQLFPILFQKSFRICLIILPLQSQSHPSKAAWKTQFSEVQYVLQTSLSGILLLWILLLWNVWRILGKHTVCIL